MKTLGKYAVFASFVGCSSGFQAEKPLNGRIEVEGHRGSRALFPENTLPAMEHALSVGVDTLETDVAITKDGVAVLHHDLELNPDICVDAKGARISKGILIHSLTLAQLKTYDCGALRNPNFAMQTPVPGTKVPTLDEFFTMVKNSKLPNAKTVRFNIETKLEPERAKDTAEPEIFVKAIFESARKHGMLDRMVLQSFDYRSLPIARKLEPKVPLSALTEDKWATFDSIIDATGAEIISPAWQLVDEVSVKHMHKRGVKVVPWTTNDQKAWDRMIAVGADGMISDNPDALIAYLKSKGLR